MYNLCLLFILHLLNLALLDNPLSRLVLRIDESSGVNSLWGNDIGNDGPEPASGILDTSNIGSSVKLGMLSLLNHLDELTSSLEIFGNIS